MLCVAWLLVAAPARGNDVPAFQPNVVDEANVLSGAEIAEINAALAEIRTTTDIWGAVYVVDALQGDTIETLAERAFRQWALGRKGDDNGLLLLLAMKDRKSRLEVGYGLEGTLTDVVTRRALDDVLRPQMRAGDVKAAIVQTFRHLASIKSGDATVPTDSAPYATGGAQASDFDRMRGFMALAVFYALLWLLPALVGTVARHRGRIMLMRCPELVVAMDRAADAQDTALGGSKFGKPRAFRIFIRIFLMINPGIFIFMGAGASSSGLAIAIALCTFATFVYLHVTLSRYRSVSAFRRFVEASRRKHRAFADKGYVREVAPGQFEYTTAYYSSPEYEASRARSSSSSSSSSSGGGSSSSGGGSSGGGGASSSW